MKKKGQAVDSATVKEVDPAIPVSLNLVLVAAILGIGIFQLSILPIAVRHSGIWWAWLLVPCALSTTTNWALIHEAIHRLLLPDARANDRCGRALSILFGCPFDSVRFPHLLHHHMNGMVADRPEYFDSTHSTRAKAALRYFPTLVFGIYAVECAATFLCLLPTPLLRRLLRMFPRAHKSDMRAEVFLLEPARLSRQRRDALTVIAVYTLALYLYGKYWTLLALSIGIRGVLVSVADNAYHYGAPLEAGANSAFNLRLRWSACILNFNLHRVHHMHPALPWTMLPRALEHEGGARYECGYFNALLRQFRGPISHTAYPRLSYRPSNFGSRLAKNAATPSRTS